MNDRLAIGRKTGDLLFDFFGVIFSDYSFGIDVPYHGHKPKTPLFDTLGRKNYLHSGQCFLWIALTWESSQRPNISAIFSCVVPFANSSQISLWRKLFFVKVNPDSTRAAISSFENLYKRLLMLSLEIPFDLWKKINS